MDQTTTDAIEVDGAAAAADDEEVRRRREGINDLLSGTFNTILRVEERSLDNRVTQGLTINEVHTLVAVGLHESNPMNVVASRLGVTLATLTACVNRLVNKGFVERTRDEQDRRRVLLTLTKQGRAVVRVHDNFHRRMIDEALADLTEEEERVLASALLKVQAFFEAEA